MKKYCSILVALAMFLSIVPCVSAKEHGNTVDITSLDISVTVPSQYHILTKDQNDPIFDEYSTEKSQMLDLLDTTNSYLIGVADDYSVLNISITPLSSDELKLIDEPEEIFWENIGELMCEHSPFENSQVEDYEVYTTNDRVFLNVDYKFYDGEFDRLDYITLIDGNIVDFSLANQGKLADLHKLALLMLVKSIENIPKNSPFIYEDTEAQVKIFVPSNWKQEELSKDREFLDIRFQNINSPCGIIYGSINLWDKYEKEANEKLSDTDKENMVDKEFISTLIGVDISEIEEITHGRKKYYKTIGKLETSSSDIYITMDEVKMFMFENGWLYQFIFCGDIDSKEYDDFSTMLLNVEYPNYPDVTNPTIADNAIPTETNPYENNESFGNLSESVNHLFMLICIALSIILGFAIVFVILIKKGII